MNPNTFYCIVWWVDLNSRPLSSDTRLLLLSRICLKKYLSTTFFNFFFHVTICWWLIKICKEHPKGIPGAGFEPARTLGPLGLKSNALTTRPTWLTINDEWWVNTRQFGVSNEHFKGKGPVNNLDVCISRLLIPLT